MATIGGLKRRVDSVRTEVLYALRAKLLGRRVEKPPIVIAGCGFGLWFRKPAIALIFQHGNFTAESTRLVAAVFLGLGPSLVGWCLIEITSRALFALDRAWPPVIAVMIPVFLNVIVTTRLHDSRPEFVGLGASAGLLAGFVLLFAIVHTRRGAWLAPH